MNPSKRIALWGGAIILLGLMVWGLARLASQPATVTDPGNLATPVSSIDHVTGNPAAKVVLVEYSDFQCPACGQFFGVEKSLLDKYQDKILFVYRHYPLPQHQNAMLAAAAAEAAANQGKFWQMHDLLFSDQASWGELPGNQTEQVFNGFAQKLQLNANQFTNDVHSTSTLERIQRDIDSGNKSNIESTPTFYLQGKKITNLQTYGDLDADIQNVIQSL